MQMALARNPPINSELPMSSSETPRSASSYDFNLGYPTQETSRRARDGADLQRAVTAYRFWYPAISVEGIFNGNRAVGIKERSIRNRCLRVSGFDSARADRVNTAPARGTERWVKTQPGRGWFAYIRIYGPEAAAFDKSWKPGDFEPST